MRDNFTLYQLEIYPPTPKRGIGLTDDNATVFIFPYKHDVIELPFNIPVEEAIRLINNGKLGAE